MTPEDVAMIVKQMHAGWMEAMRCTAERLDRIDESMLQLSKSLNQHVENVNEIVAQLRDQDDWWKGE